jgi:hypothetical protein
MAITGCNTSQTNQNNAEWQAELLRLRAEWEQEYAAWKSLNIENYQFVFSQIGSWYKITVRDGTHQSSIDISTDELYPGEDCPRTIDELFEWINFNDKLYNSTERNFSVSYDSQYHYPVEYRSIGPSYHPVYGGAGGNAVILKIMEFTMLD